MSTKACCVTDSASLFTRHPGNPLLTPERWLRDFDQLDLKPGVRPKVLKENTVRMLGLGA